MPTGVYWRSASKSDRAFSAPIIIAASGCEASVSASTWERVKGLIAHLGGIDLLGIMMGSHGLTCRCAMKARKLVSVIRKSAARTGLRKVTGRIREHARTLSLKFAHASSHALPPSILARCRGLHTRDEPGLPGFSTPGPPTNLGTPRVSRRDKKGSRVALGHAWVRLYGQAGQPAGTFATTCSCLYPSPSAGIRPCWGRGGARWRGGPVRLCTARRLVKQKCPNIPVPILECPMRFLVQVARRYLVLFAADALHLSPR